LELYDLAPPCTGIYAPKQLVQSQKPVNLYKILLLHEPLLSLSITVSPTQSNKLRPDQMLTQIQHFLKTLELPSFPSVQARKRFLKKASEFFMKAGRLYKRNSDRPPLLVILENKRQASILTRAHEELGHKGELAVFELVRMRFFWPHLRANVHQHISSCHQCQIRSIKKVEIPLTVSLPSHLFQKIYIDVMFMPPSGGFHFIAAVKDDLSGVTEVRALRQCNSKNLAQFFWEQVYCQYGAVQCAVTDNGPEVKGAFEILLRRMKIPQVHISPYNKHANGVVERGHFILREAIVKSCERDTNGHIKNWRKHIELAAFADRVTVSSVTGYSPYYLLHGTHPILPFDLSEMTFLVDGFKPDMTTEELLTLRI
jgi:Integrase zinc binding domain